MHLHTGYMNRACFNKGTTDPDKNRESSTQLNLYDQNKHASSIIPLKIII
jgi:hypothetical protein